MGGIARGFVAAALICSSLECAAQGGAFVQAGANALLAIDQHRATVIDRIVSQWGGQLAGSSARLTDEQLRTMLMGVRADHLLAASLAGTLDGLRDVLAAAMSSPAPVRDRLVQAKALGDANDDLVYTPINPCRIVDTRSGAGGFLVNNTQRDWKASNPGGNFTFQGGSSTDCGIPASPAAVLANLVVTGSSQPGVLYAWSFAQPAPTASTLNYAAGETIANATIVPLAQGGAEDVSIFVSSGTHVVIDVMGYFKRASNSAGVFEVAVNGSQALQIKPDPTSPIWIAGSNANSVTAGASGAVIAGGGAPGTQVTFSNGPGPCTSPPGGPCANRVTDAFGTIGGGLANQAGDAAGTNNDAPLATIAGGLANVASGVLSAIVGGQLNVAGGPASFIGGGDQNAASGFVGAIGGGQLNTASGNSSTVAGGDHNAATGQNSFVGGGTSNTASGLWSTASGGSHNSAAGTNSIVGGGDQNAASGFSSTVGGGEFSTANGDYGTVGGGAQNAASGKYATVPGGVLNIASGDYTFAAGRSSKAVGTGTFAISDSTALNFLIAAPNYFGARFTGGFMFATGVDGGGSFLTGCTLPSGGGTFSCTSDRATKTAFADVDSKEVLARVAALAITEWRFLNEPADVRHMGPVAQDFRAAFGLGYDDKSIGVQDAQGVAFAAIQGLRQIVDEKDTRIAALEQRLKELERVVEALTAKQ